MKMKNIADKLFHTGIIDDEELEKLLCFDNDSVRQYLGRLAARGNRHIYSGRVFLRGLIEISNICRNDCFYCGLRKSNTRVNRYRLSESRILSIFEEGVEAGFHSFVLQSGEQDTTHPIDMPRVIRRMKQIQPDTTIALSLGEQSHHTYQQLFNAGASRYLLREETIRASHYATLHPAPMSLDERISCLHDLRDIGFYTGAGFMAGAPFQQLPELIADIRFIEKFKPEMIAIGPFIAHPDTPLAHFADGSARLTLLLISILRCMHPRALIPATSALNRMEPEGYLKGVLAGANVIMQNLTPDEFRNSYELYKRKNVKNKEIQEEFSLLAEKLNHAGYTLTRECDH